VTRKQPYRNEWIILVIQQHFFSGGPVSFANEFKHIFPTSKDRNGVTVREVPVAMVALVATAVRSQFIYTAYQLTVLGLCCLIV
jgi:hypothetical protein